MLNWYLIRILSFYIKQQILILYLTCKIIYKLYNTNCIKYISLFTTISPPPPLPLPAPPPLPGEGEGVNHLSLSLGGSLPWYCISYYWYLLNRWNIFTSWDYSDHEINSSFDVYLSCYKFMCVSISNFCLGRR